MERHTAYVSGTPLMPAAHRSCKRHTADANDTAMNEYFFRYYFRLRRSQVEYLSTPVRYTPKKATCRAKQRNAFDPGWAAQLDPHA